jgi:lysophospholipase L1-like esterase
MRRVWLLGAAAAVGLAVALVVALGGRQRWSWPAERGRDSGHEEIGADDPRLFYSPWVWYADGEACRTTHLGAALRFGWTGRTLRLKVDVSMWDRAGVPRAQYPVLNCAIDGGPVRPVRLAPGASVCVLAEGMAAGRHRCAVSLRSIDFHCERWRAGRQVAVWRVSGLELDPGATVYADPDLRSRRALFFGDSILDGAFNLGAETDALQSWAEPVAARLGAEPARVGFEAQGYTVSGGSETGNVPPFFLPDDRSQRTWDYLDSWHSRLVRGRFAPRPDYVFLCHGVNDASRRVPAPRVEAAVRGLLPRLRAAAGASAVLFVLVPFDGSNRAPIAAAVSDFCRATSDRRCHLIDVSKAARALARRGTAADGSRWSFDGLHPSAAAHAELGDLVAEAALKSLLGSESDRPSPGAPAGSR